MTAFVTPADIKLRFAEFENVADDRIDIFINDSALYVDETWPASTRAYAQSLLVAHFLALNGEGGDAAVGGIALPVNTAGITRFRMKDVEVGLSVNQADASLDDTMKATRYGRQYQELVKRYFGGGLLR